MAANSQLAKSIFQKTADDVTIVEDIYKKTDASTVNSFQDSTSNTVDFANQFSFLSKYNSNLSLSSGASLFGNDTGSITDSISSALSDNYSKAKTLITGAMSGNKAAIATLQSGTNSITGMLKDASNVFYQVNGVVTSIKNGNLSDLRGITNTLNSVIGRTGVLLSPNGSLGSIYGSLVDQAGAAGITDSFSVIASYVKESTALANSGSIIYNMATTSLPGALARGDLRQVASMTDFIGKGAITMLNPSAVSTLSKNNRSVYTPSQIGGSNGQFVQYQGAYQKIDPNWNKSDWSPKGTTTLLNDLSTLMGASKETKDVFVTGSKMSSDDSTKWYAALEVFNTKISVDDEISRRYPTSIGSTSTGMTTRDVDPRLYTNP